MTDTSSHTNADTIKTNPRAELEEILRDKDTNFQAAFSFTKPYPNAPNPVLELAGVGTIGLPLSTGDTFAIQGKAKAGGTPEDGWEWDASKVVCTHPDWKKFIDEVSGDAGRYLNVAFERCEMSNLTLHEKSSHSSSLCIDDYPKDTVATIHIILPSSFTGGAARLFHGGFDARYNLSGPRSKFDTTVLAFYPSATTELEPISTGFRLSLTYHLIHPTAQPRPAPSNTLMDSLSRVMTAWNSDTTAPSKILVLLEHKGKDAQRVGALELLAQKLGFGLGLASATRTFKVTGGWYSLQATAQKPDIKSLHLLGGRLIRHMVEYNAERETIPIDVNREIELGEYDESYDERSGRQRKYEGTFLVIWPSWNSFNMKYGEGPGFALGCEDLLKPGEDEAWQRKLAAHLLSAGPTSPLAAKAVCQLAVKLGDATLWHQAIVACSPEKGFTTVDEEFQLQAIEHFGFAAVQDSFDVMLAADKNNSTSFGFLNKFGVEKWKPFSTNVKRVNALRTKMRSWAASKKDDVLRSLRAPTMEECPLLLDELDAHDGGPSFLSTVVLPQLLSIADSDFLLQFAEALHAKSGSEDCQITPETITSLPMTSISKATFFSSPPPPPPPPPPSAEQFMYGYARDSEAFSAPNDASEKVRKYTQVCLDRGRGQLLGNIVARVTDMTGFSVSDSQICAQSVLLRFISFLAELPPAKPRDTRKALIATLQAVAIPLYVEWIGSNPKRFIKNKKQEMAKLVSATAIGGDGTVFISRVVPLLESMKVEGSRALEDPLPSIIEELRDSKTPFVFPKGYKGRDFDSVISSLGSIHINRAKFSTATDVSNTLNWCITNQLPDLCPSVVAIVTDAAKLNTNHINTVLVPLLPMLQDWGSKNSCLEQVAFGFQRIVAAWTDTVLGAQPTGWEAFKPQFDKLASWTCPGQCTKDCDSLFSFLTRESQECRRFHSIGAVARRHYEEQLTRFARGMVTYTMIPKSPQGLEVKKNQPLHEYSAWCARREKGRAMLKSISVDENVQKRLLSQEYPRIVSALEGKYVPPGTVVSTPQSTSTPRASASANPVRRPSQGTPAGQPSAKRRKV